MPAFFSDGQPFFTLRNSREVIQEFYAWAHGLQDEGNNFAYRHVQFYDVLRAGESPDYYLILHPLNDETQVMMKLKYADRLIPDTQWYSARDTYHRTSVIRQP